MTIRSMPIKPGAYHPSKTNPAFLEYADQNGSRGKQERLLFPYDGGSPSDSSVIAQFIVPESYVGSPVLRMHVVNGVTGAGNTSAWQVGVTKVSEDDSVTGAVEEIGAVSEVASHASVADALRVLDYDMSNADGMAKGDTVFVRIKRNVPSGSDNITANVFIINTAFRYSDT